MTARVGVLISGRGSNMAALLYASRAPGCPYAIALVVANDPDAPGLALARAEGIETVAFTHKGLKRAEFDAKVDAELRRAGVTHVALAGYMRLLSAGFVQGWEGRMLNIHPSLLPAYKGLDTHARVLEAGDAVTGCSVHLVTEGLDEGPVLGATQVAVLPGDTPDTLAARVLIAEHQLYPRVLAELIAAERSPDRLLDRVRTRAMALPRAAEKVSHGMPTFHVEGGKVFAHWTQDHHGDAVVALLVRTSGQDEQAMLIDRDPGLYYRPAYFGPAGWVGIRMDHDTPDWDLIDARLLSSWRLAAPRKLAEML